MLSWERFFSVFLGKTNQQNVGKLPLCREIQVGELMLSLQDTRNTTPWHASVGNESPSQDESLVLYKKRDHFLLSAS